MADFVFFLLSSQNARPGLVSNLSPHDHAGSNSGVKKKGVGVCSTVNAFPPALRPLSVHQNCCSRTNKKKKKCCSIHQSVDDGMDKDIHQGQAPVAADAVVSIKKTSFSFVFFFG